MCGSFLGLDTMHLTEFGKFDFLSYISGRDELFSYCGKLDIRGLIAQHAATGVIPVWLPEDYDDGSSFVGNLNGSDDSDVLPGGHWDHCLKGATYVLYMDSI
jgi:hypothetical protein